MSKLTLGFALVVLGFTFGLVQFTTIAQEKKSDVTGTWKWTQQGFGGDQQYVLTLKQDGEKLTGTLAGGFGGEDAKIEEGSIKSGTITFKVTRDFGQGRPIVTVYTGKIEGDNFKGKSETIFAQEFEAKRGS